MDRTHEEDLTVIAKRLRLGAGFLYSEREWIVHRLAALGSRLRSFQESAIDLVISVKDRDGVGQQVALECWVSRTPRMHLVATSPEPELALALNEVRIDLIRLIDDAKTRTEPRNNRALRHPQL